jgi:hypothetical protein
VPRHVQAAAGLVLWCAVAGGCVGGGGGPDESGPPVTYDPCASVAVVTDSGITADESAGVAAGIALWNQSAGTRLSLAAPAATAPSGDDAGADAGTPGLPLHFQTAAAPFHGLYDAPNGQVFINTDLTGEALAVTVAHEIGHAFGLVHIPADQRHSVMNPNNLVVEPTAEDVDTLAMRWGVCLASPSP